MVFSKKAKCTACGKQAMLLSALNNVVLALLKGVAGYITGSKALLADALHSGADIICAAFGILGTRLSDKKMDADHPYGYGKIEFIVGMVVGIILFSAAANILYSSIYLIFFSRETLRPPGMMAFWVALLSIYANVVVSRYTLCAAQSINSPALKAISADNISDAYSSIPVAVAVLGAQLGIPALDPIGAVFVGLLIGRIAVGLMVENYQGIMDGSASDEEIRDIAAAVKKLKTVRGIGYLKTRRTGKSVWVDLQVMVDGEKTVLEAHTLSEEIRTTLLRKIETIGSVQVTLKPV